MSAVSYPLADRDSLVFTDPLTRGLADVRRRAGLVMMRVQTSMLHGGALQECLLRDQCRMVVSQNDRTCSVLRRQIASQPLRPLQTA
jgi:hypothetical protein